MADHATATMTPDHQHEHTGASVGTYIRVGLILFVVTIIEIAASFLTSTFGFPHWIQIAVLLLLSVFKGVMVVLFFMHLKFDSRWFSFMMVAGMFFAVMVLVSFLLLFSYKGYAF